jgi:hypothetical protein
VAALRFSTGRIGDEKTAIFLAIPLPAPPSLVGALLVFVMTVGFVGTDIFLHSPP